MHRLLSRVGLAAALLAAAVGAAAHDTWFAPLPASSSADEARFALGTGNRFPLFEQAVDRRYLARGGCRAGDDEATPIALEAVRHDEHATLLRAASGARDTLSCWLQLDPFEIELPPDKVAIYFREIRPSAAVQAAWAALRSRGLPFVERYTKSARIDGTRAAPLPAGTAMDVLREAPAGALAVGSEATFRVLRDGRPLAGFNVELVSERSAVGLWHRTDADGRIRARLPLPGRWLLRGTDLRLAANDPTRWESQFVSYAFEVN